MSHQSHLIPLIRVCQTVDVHLLLVLLNLLLQTTEFLTENHRAAGACLCVCVCVCVCVCQSASLPVCIFRGSSAGGSVCTCTLGAGVCVFLFLCIFVEGSEELVHVCLLIGLNTMGFMSLML